MLTEEFIIKGCKQKNAEAQIALYNKYAGKMNAVCFRYAGSDDAKDICQEGFIKIFSFINKYKGEGSFEGWMRKIMVNTALDHLRKSKKHLFVSLESDALSENQIDSKAKGFIEMEESEEFSVFNANFTNEQLLNIINSLPDIYKIVFNLHCIENYSHKEIAEMLSINEDTSRSRLRRARNMLKTSILEVFNKKNIESKSEVNSRK